MNKIMSVGASLIVLATVSIYLAYEKGHGPGGDLDDDEIPFNETFHILQQQWPLQVSPDQLLSAAEPLDISMDTLSEALREAANMERYRQTLEEELSKNNLTTVPGTPSCYHQIVTAAKPEAESLIQQGYTMDWIAKDLAARLKLNKSTAAPLLATMKDVQFAESCSLPTSCEGQPERYRTADGTCNNVKKPEWGAAMTPYRRMLIARYDDGLSVPRTTSSDGSTTLPSARLVSTTINGSGRPENSSLTTLFMQWGEFVAHDISSIAIRNDIRCCLTETLPSLRHPDCYPIHFPSGDSKVSCMQFSRSAPAPACSLGARNQLNQVSAFLDGSNIYGSSEKEQNSVRSLEGGMLRYSLGPNNSELLPVDQVNKHNLFTAGDARVNEQVVLTALHTVWMKEHNRVAAILRAANTNWTDNEVFQESRRIVIAELQHITYNEYLPSLLGYELSYELGFTSEEYDDSYDAQIDPSVANVVASAALRFGHSQIQNSVRFMAADNKTEEYKPLHEVFFDPLELYHFPNFRDIMSGQITTAAGTVDTHFSREVTHHLFDKTGGSHGLDLVAIDIQRGRDHGIAPYNMWRKHCNLSQISFFEDLRRIGWSEEMVKDVQKLYRSVDDMDLYVGGLAEPPISGGVVGPTFACILIDQFVRLKQGDRFWYETSMHPQAFTEEQLLQLRSSSMARVLCDNVEDLAFCQPMAFQLPGSQNVPVSCSDDSIPSIDLTHWKIT